VSGSCGWCPLPYDEIVAWVEAHAHELPRSLAELSAFPIAFRRVIINHVSTERRTRFWQDHLRTFLTPESTLSQEQRTFVDEAIGRMPDIFASPRADAQAKTRHLEDRMRHLFTREQAAAMFGIVGPPEPPEGLPLPLGTRLTPVE
jgi:hypothetical protein